MANIFDLSKLKKLAEKRRISALLLVDTNIIIRESDFANWKTPLDEPAFVLSDIVILELERVKTKPGSGEAAKEAIRKINKLLQAGNITNGIHLDHVGWFISIPSHRAEELKSELAALDDVVRVFGDSDTKLLLLAKECNKIVTGIPAIFVTGDINLFNIVVVNDVPAYLFTGFPTHNMDRVVNEYLTAVPDWDDLLSEIQDTTKFKTSVSVASFRWFYEEGLMNLIMSKSPIIPQSKRIELYFISLELREATMDEESCLATGATYACPLYLKTRVLIKETGEIKEQDLFLGDIPMITRDGMFVISGKKRVLLIEPIINRSLERTLLDTALDTIKFKALKRMGRISPERVTPARLVDPYPLMAAIDELFSSSQRLSV